MPGIRERDQSGKIKDQGKRKGGRPVQQEARRVMTAKLKKELAQQKRGGGSATERPRGDSATTEAVDQVEQITGAAVHETGRQIKRGVSRAVTKAKEDRQQIKERQRQPDTQGQPSDTPFAAPGVYGADTPPSQPPHQAPTGDTSALPPPTPGERMRQRAADQRKERLTHPRAGTPSQGAAPAPIHYGKPTPTPSPSTKNPSAGGQSINPSIKERPRRSFRLKEKPTAGAFTPKTRPSAGQAARSVAAPGNDPVPVGGKHTAAIMDRARRKAQREAQRTIFQNTKKSAKAAADLSKKAVAATTKAGKALIGALSALVGGSVLVAALCVIFLVAAVIASPFGILFSNEPTPGAMPLNAAVGQLNMELSNSLEALQTGSYDSIDIQGHGPDWREVVAVFAAKTAGADAGVDVAALTSDRVDRLKAVFWDMCAISTSVETIDHPAVGSTAAWTEKILHITITAKTAGDMRTVYLFTGEQNSALTELLADRDGIGGLLGDLSVSQEDASELLRRLPTDLSPERRAVVETACKLVGKVNYFWGGKSRVLGWDSRWGTIQKVWAAGNSTTGTYRPFGLDCSGFVDWVFYNISDGAYTIGHGGGAHAQHIYCAAISWDQAQPGDLVFYPGDTHVGIVGGWDGSGNILIIHCAYGCNNVVITRQEGFTSIGRPMYYGS